MERQAQGITEDDDVGIRIEETKNVEYFKILLGKGKKTTKKVFLEVENGDYS